MNKLPVIVFTIFAFQAHVQAMEDTSKSQPTYTHKVDLHNQSNSITCFPEFSHNITDTTSDFYKQDKATQKNKIKADLAIINQYEILYEDYLKHQLHKLSTQHAYIQKISVLHDIAQQKTIDVKKDDELINNPIFFHTIGMAPETPSLQFLLLAQKYISPQDSLSNEYKQIILETINMLLPSQIGLQAELLQYNPQNLDDIALMLPVLYGRAWNNHKFTITSGLISIINKAKLQRNVMVHEFNNLQKVTDYIVHQKNQYADALALMNQENQAATIPVESVQPIEETAVCLIQDQAQTTGKKKPAKKSVPQAPVLSAKQQAALVAAEKRAEQSRNDKERRSMKQEDERSAVVAKCIALSKTTTKKSKNSTPKKPNTKNSFNPIFFDEEDALLQAAIEENKKIEDAKALEQAIKLHELLTAQGNAIEQSVKNNHAMIEQDQELINYLEFIEARNKKYCQLQAAKEIETHNEYEKLQKLSYKNRAVAKRKIDTDLSKKYSMLSEEEQQVLNLLLVYAEKVLDKKAIDNTPLEDIEIIVQKIVKAECHLAQQGLSLKWYLAAYPDLYKKMKEQYIKFQTIIQQSSRIQHEIMKSTHQKVMSQDPLHKQKEVAKILQRIHTNNGVLDISKLLYPIITRQELDALGCLQPMILDAAQDDIKFLFANRTAEHDYTKIEPVVKNLLHQAEIKSYPNNMIDQIINNTAVIACLKSEDEKKEMLQNVDLKIFNELQISNELSTISLTDHQMADIAKAQATAMRSLIDIVQV